MAMATGGVEQPKRPVGGAYGIFLAKHRPEFTKACQGQKASAISKLAGERWGQLSPEEKEPYSKEFLVVKEKYEKDMKAFLANGGEKQLGPRALATQKRKAMEEGKDGKRQKKAKDPNRPKKPTGGAFGVFLNKNRAALMKECPGSMTGVSKLASARFKALTEAQRKPYEEEFKQLQEAWREAMQKYKTQAGGAAEVEDENDEEEE